MNKEVNGNTKLITKEIKEQILAIRDTGETNMFDIGTVQYIAKRDEYYELADLIDEHIHVYLSFILHGDECNE